MRTKLFFLILILVLSSYPEVKASSGYGEDSEALGQFVDDFENLDNVTVFENLERITPNNYIVLDQAPYEYSFTEYFENFPAGWTVRTAAAGTITKDNTHVYNGSWAVKIYTPDIPDKAFAWRGMNEITGDYNLQFQIYPDGLDEPDNCYILFLFDVGPGTHMILLIDFDAGTYYLRNQDSDSTDNVGELTPDEWNKVNVDWNDATNKLTFWINDVYQGQFDALADRNPDRIYIGDTGLTGQAGIYWLDDLVIGNSSFGKFETEGYMITEDYLDYTLGESLTLLTNTSILNSTGITVEFSSDNSTWVNNHGDVGSVTIENGFFAIDLRDLNYTQMFMRYNFSAAGGASGGDFTPREFQSRLVSTEGEAGAGAVTVTVESDAPWIALAIILSIIAFLLATRIKR